MKRRVLLFLCFALACAHGGVLCAPAQAERREEQRHGYVFEEWVRATFFGNYAGGYTQEWDVAKEANTRYGEIPVSIKTARYGRSVDLGDALRQYSINERFLIIIGFWKQEGEKKRIVATVAATVEPALWKKLWEPVALDDLQRLDAVVKNRQTPYREARLQAKKIKNAPPFTQAIISVHPKIDSKNQRRVQCSLSFREVFEYLAPKADPAPQTAPTLFGVKVLDAFESVPRR